MLPYARLLVIAIHSAFESASTMAWIFSELSGPTMPSCGPEYMPGSYPGIGIGSPSSHASLTNRSPAGTWA